MSDTHMVDHMLARCPRCGRNGWNDEELETGVHGRPKTFVYECRDCSYVSRLRVDTAITRWQERNEANRRRDD